jgi:competence protein ComEC
LFGAHTGEVSWWWLGLAAVPLLLAVLGRMESRYGMHRKRGNLGRLGRVAQLGGAVTVGKLGIAALAGALAIAGAQQGARFLRPACTPDAPCALALPGKAMIEGWIATDPVFEGDGMRFDFEVAAVRAPEGWRSVRSGVRVHARGVQGAWQVGDCLRLEAWLRLPRNFANPGAFDYVRHLRSRGIDVTGSIWPGNAVERCERRQTWVRERIAAARRRVGAVIDGAIAPAASGLIRALVIGDRSGVSRDTEASFSRAGVAHVLSISGLHFAVVAGTAFTVFRALFGLHPAVLARGLAPRLAAGAAVPAALFYLALAGAQIPTLRAAVMAAVYFVGVIANRRPEVLRSLALGALIITAWWPGAVFEASFALSFVAVLGVVLGLAHLGPRRPPATEEGRGPGAQGGRGVGAPGPLARTLRWIGRAVHGSLAVSIGAGVGTAPLTALHLNMVSLLGPAANLIVVPLLSGATVVGLVGVAAGTLSAGLGGFVLCIAAALAQAGEYVAVAAGSLPAAAVRVVTPTALEIGLVYVLLGCAVGWRRRWAPVLAVIALAAAAGDAAYWLRQRYARPNLRVTFLDVGQGDAAVVEFPGSAVLLVDGGGFPRTDFDPGEAIVARYLWARKIARVDFVAMSHADLDHAGGLGFLVGEFRPREFWWNGRRDAADALSRALEAVVQAGTGHRVLDAESPTWRVGPVAVRALHPARTRQGVRSVTRGPHGAYPRSRNDDSLVLRLEWGATSVLFSGDIEAAGERELVAAMDGRLRTAVLKVPHHGSRTSSGADLLGAVDPAVAVVSVGAGNRYGFPAPEVRRRYVSRGVCVLRTDERGAIIVEGSAQGFRTAPPCLPSDTDQR